MVHTVYVGAATVKIRICYTVHTVGTVYTDKIPNNTVTIQYKAVDAFGILSIEKYCRLLVILSIGAFC